MDYLSSSYFYDYDHELIQDFVSEFSYGSELAKAVGLYYKVRDGWRYSPYGVSIKKEYWKASYISTKELGHCLDKSILYVTGLRALGIPARVRLAKVINHIAVENLIEKLGTNELTPHGMVDVYLQGKWVKASPAFNKELCERCEVAPLEFDGQSDSVFQEYNREGKQFMEYIEDYGHFEDFPLDFVFNNLKEHYFKFIFGRNSS